MEQTTSTTSTTAAPAPQGALAVTAAAPAGSGATDATTQFGNLLDALQQTAALAPVTESGDEGKAGTPAKDGEEQGTATEADASAAAAILVASLVPAALPVPAPAPAASAPAAAAGEPAGQPAAVPVTALAAAAPTVLQVAGTVAPTAAAAPATTIDATAPATAIALPDGDVDPALVQAAVTAAGEGTAPARVATGAATKGSGRVTATAAHATAASAERSTPVTGDVGSTTTAAASDTAPVAPATGPDAGSSEQGASSGSGSNPAHPARIDLQVQPAPRAREAAPAASAAPAVPPLDRERLDRLADGLAVRLRVSNAAEGARIRMQLEPRELGEVVVRLEIRDGIAHAHLIAESQDAGRTLSASLGDLRSALADRGLQLESVSVRVAGEGASNNGGQADGSQTDRRPRSPLTFGRLEPVAAQATDPADRALDGHAVWMLA
jgi:flagellar hook-length control protein FliK